MVAEGFMQRMDGRLRSYLYAGHGPARWLANMNRAAEPWLAMMTPDQLLLALAEPPPLADVWSLPATLRLLTGPSTLAEAATDDGRPNRSPLAASTNAASKPSMIRKSGSEPVSPVTTLTQGYSPKATESRLQPPLLARRTQLTQPELRRLVGELRLAAWPDDAERPRIRGLEALQDGAVARTRLTELPSIHNASARLIEVLGQHLTMQTQPSLQISGLRPAAHGEPAPEAIGASPRGWPRSTPEEGRGRPTTPSQAASIRSQAIPGAQIESAAVQPERRTGHRHPPAASEVLGSTKPTRFTAQFDQLLSALIKYGFARPLSGEVASHGLLQSIAAAQTAFRSEPAARLEDAISSVAVGPLSGHSSASLEAILGTPGGVSQQQRFMAPVTPATSRGWPAVPARPVATTAVLQTLVNAWARPRWPDSPASTTDGSLAPTMAPAAVPITVSIAEASPAPTVTQPLVQNTFNVTVHITGGLADETELAERLARLLIDQAKRHGIDVA